MVCTKRRGYAVVSGSSVIMTDKSNGISTEKEDQEVRQPGIRQSVAQDAVRRIFTLQDQVGALCGDVDRMADAVDKLHILLQNSLRRSQKERPRRRTMRDQPPNSSTRKTDLDSVEMKKETGVKDLVKTVTYTRSNSVESSDVDSNISGQSDLDVDLGVNERSLAGTRRFWKSTGQLHNDDSLVTSEDEILDYMTPSSKAREVKKDNNPSDTGSLQHSTGEDNYLDPASLRLQVKPSDHDREQNFDSQRTQEPVYSSPLSQPDLIAHWTSEQDQKFKENKRNHIVQELIDTERSYCNSLTTLVNVIGNTFRRSGHVSQRDMSLLLPNTLPQLLCFHRDLLSQLHQLGSLQGRSQTMKKHPYLCPGHILLAVIERNDGEMLKLYRSYFTAFPIAVNTLTRLKRQSTKCQNLLLDLQRHPSCEGLDPGAFLLTPVQRMPRYLLLTKQLLDLLPPDHVDRATLERLCNLLHDFLTTVNSAMHTALNSHKKKHHQMNGLPRASSCDSINVAGLRRSSSVGLPPGGRPRLLNKLFSSQQRPQPDPTVEVNEVKSTPIIEPSSSQTSTNGHMSQQPFPAPKRIQHRAFRPSLKECVFFDSNSGNNSSLNSIDEMEPADQAVRQIPLPKSQQPRPLNRYQKASPDLRAPARRLGIQRWAGVGSCSQLDKGNSPSIASGSDLQVRDDVAVRDWRVGTRQENTHPANLRNMRPDWTPHTPTNQLMSPVRSRSSTCLSHDTGESSPKGSFKESLKKMFTPKKKTKKPPVTVKQQPTKDTPLYLYSNRIGAGQFFNPLVPDRRPSAEFEYNCTNV